MSSLVFHVALRTEMVAVRLGAARAEIVRFGMGERAAKAAVEKLASSGDTAPILLLGCSGGLGAESVPGDLIVASELGLVGESERFPLPSAVAVAAMLAASGVKASTAPIVTASRLVVGQAARDEAGADGAVAVDMESRWFAPLAARRSLIVVRSIIDVPNKELFSLSTPAAAVLAGRALTRAARVLAKQISTFDRQLVEEQVGDN